MLQLGYLFRMKHHRSAFLLPISRHNRIADDPVLRKELLMESTAFIWDLDGNLLDSYGIIVSSLHQTLSEFGVERDPSEIHKEMITYSFGVYLSKLEKEEGIDVKAVRERFSEINDSRAMSIKPVEHAAEILTFIQNKKIPNFVYTHKGITTKAVLQNIGLYDYFVEIVSAVEGFPKKPDPAAINYLIQKYGLSRENCFYVGDRTLDIACACNAGIKSIFYLPKGSYACPNGKETYIVSDLLEIRNLIHPDQSNMR